MDSSMAMFFVIMAVTIGIIFHERIISFFQYLLWKKNIQGVHDYNDSKIRDSLLKISENAFELSGENVPYGRSKWFLAGNENFNTKVDFSIVEFYGYSPIRSKEELDFHEYGILLTQDGIYVSSQSTEKNNDGKYIVKSKFYPFEGLWDVRLDNDSNRIKLLYKGGRIEVLDYSGDKKQMESLKNGLTSLIQTGYTYDLETNYISEKISESISDAREVALSDDLIAARVGALGAAYANLHSHFKGELLNSIVNNPQGHGFAAEYANDLVDKIKNPFLRVERVGQNNARNGADRIVGNTKIQTKYLSSARNSVNAAFEKKQDGGMYRYEGMQLEVPKDQYIDALEVMKQRISEGKVPGVTDPEDAKYIVRKGSVTWKEAKLIAEGGNITSLKYDAIDGVVQTLPAASICFIIMFAQAKWAGADTKDAAISAAKAGITSLCLGTAIYAGSQQFAKVFTQQIAQKTGQKIAADAVAKNAGWAISFGVILVPNIFNTLTGRISSQQLLKNTVVAGGGFLAGVASSTGAGAALGSIAPGAGTAVGAVVGATAGVIGGIAGSTVTKKIMDRFIEDDRVEMFAILKEEYLDVVMSISLSQEEFNEVQELIFDSSLEGKLKNMFKERKKGNSRVYARENIVEKAINKTIQKRETIADIELIQGIDYLVCDA